MAIRARFDKIDADLDELIAALDASSFTELPVSAAHASGAHRLPMRHSHPFDRSLIAQAIAEPLKLMTADSAFPAYSELVILI